MFFKEKHLSGIGNTGQEFSPDPCLNKSGIDLY